MNNLEMMRKRLETQGGVRQEDRMIKDKWRTLQKALEYSYQACSVQMVLPYNQVLDASLDLIDPEMGIFPIVRALINPDKVKQDYDDKILSIDYRENYEPGTIFEWKGTNTNWIIYTEEITEDAYFRGEIRRCRYKIKFKDKDDNWCATWAAIRGPVETTISSILKNLVRIDRPNLSLNILMPLNEKTLYAFDRYSEFLFAGKCWKVEATDSISMRNILEINAQEDYINLSTDDTENEIKNGLIIEEVDPSPNSVILGETFIKPRIVETYTAPATNGNWSVRNNASVTICPVDEVTATVVWDKATSGNFTLVWSNGIEEFEKEIIVESLY